MKISLAALSFLLASTTPVWAQAGDSHAAHHQSAAATAPSSPADTQIPSAKPTRELGGMKGKGMTEQDGSMMGNMGQDGTKDDKSMQDHMAGTGCEMMNGNMPESSSDSGPSSDHNAHHHNDAR